MDEEWSNYMVDKFLWWEADLFLLGLLGCRFLVWRYVLIQWWEMKWSVVSQGDRKSDLTLVQAKPVICFINSLSSLCNSVIRICLFYFPCCSGMELDMLVAVALKHWLLYVKLIKLVACFVMLSFVSIQVRCLWDLQKLSSWMRSLLAWTVLPLTRLWSACASQCMFWMELWLSLFSSQHQRHMHSLMISSYSQKVSLFIKVRVTWCLSSLRPWASGVHQGKGLLTSCKR